MPRPGPGTEARKRLDAEALKRQDAMQEKDKRRRQSSGDNSAKKGRSGSKTSRKKSRKGKS